MQTPPELFDTGLLARRRARAARLGPADFLHAAVAGEVSERLREINRTFRDPAVIGPRAGLWAGILAEGGVAPAALAADAEVLPLAEGAHDLVVHGLALHWSNDPVGQLVQARRALRPDGLLLAALFGGETLHELRAVLAEAEIETLGGLSPRVAPMGEIRDLGGLLQRAGLALPVADSQRFDVSYPDALALMRDLRAMGETNVMRDRLRRPMPREMLARAAALYAERFGTGDGRVRATLRRDLPHRLGASAGPAEGAPPRLGQGPARRCARRRGAQRRRAAGRWIRRAPMEHRRSRRSAPGARARRSPAAAAGQGRRRPRQPRHAGRHRLLVDAALPRRVPVRPAGDRLSALEVAAAAAARHPQQAAVHLRRQLPQDLEPRGRREPAADHHQGADRGRRRPARRALRRPGDRRFRDALRQSLDHLGDRAAAGARAASGWCSSRSIRNIRRRAPPPPTTRRSGR